jgi:hypothetical protein
MAFVGKLRAHVAAARHTSAKSADATAVVNWKEPRGRVRCMMELPSIEELFPEGLPEEPDDATAMVNWTSFPCMMELPSIAELFPEGLPEELDEDSSSDCHSESSDWDDDIVDEFGDEIDSQMSMEIEVVDDRSLPAHFTSVSSCSTRAPSPLSD